MTEMTAATGRCSASRAAYIRVTPNGSHRACWSAGRQHLVKRRHDAPATLA
jgi:hypothetical protein